EKENYSQLLSIISSLAENEKVEGISVDEIRKEIFELLPENNELDKFEFNYTQKDNLNKLFKHGCDFVVKQFDDNFEKAFNK
ncbi:MAG: hypothetical protein ACQERU_12570, partial [Bacteroidota bacterium]